MHSFIVFFNTDRRRCLTFLAFSFFLLQAGIRGTRIRNPGMCESVHSYGLEEHNQIPVGRVEALAIAHTFVSEIDDIMYIQFLF